MKLMYDQGPVGRRNLQGTQVRDMKQMRDQGSAPVIVPEGREGVLVPKNDVESCVSASCPTGGSESCVRVKSRQGRQKRGGGEPDGGDSKTHRGGGIDPKGTSGTADLTVAEGVGRPPRNETPQNTGERLVRFSYCV